MKKINRQLLVLILTFCFGASFSQTTDSLSIFPNPFDSSATIHFEIGQSDTITLRVFNSSGQIIETFFQSTILPGGIYNINLSGDSLANGIYFVRLDIGSTKNIIKKAVKNDSTLSIEDNNVDHKVLVYPNPSMDQITIPVNGIKTIILTDLKGKVIKSFLTDQQVISLLDITAGQYFITILENQNKIKVTQKLLKIE